MTAEQRKFRDAVKLIGLAMGALHGITHWDVPLELKIKIRDILKELDDGADALLVD